MTDCAILLVTCCLEQSRYDILKQVVDNIEQQDPTFLESIEVFDNASTIPGTADLLKRFKHVFRADRNVGYWTAIDWWIDNLKHAAPRYTYIIESDMIHYALPELGKCVDFLDRHSELGAMRLHEYSIADHHLYNKDAPLQNSHRNLWQSHTNKVTNAAVKHEQVEGQFWKTNFLTQLPALNRYHAMCWCFDQLRAHGRFTELDFQRFYHLKFPEISILDGGIFNCDLNPYGTPGVTGSWTHPSELQRLGYQSTRFASIVPRDDYTVTNLT